MAQLLKAYQLAQGYAEDPYFHQDFDEATRIEVEGIEPSWKTQGNVGHCTFYGLKVTEEFLCLTNTELAALLGGLPPEEKKAKKEKAISIPWNGPGQQNTKFYLVDMEGLSSEMCFGKRKVALEWYHGTSLEEVVLEASKNIASDQAHRLYNVLTNASMNARHPSLRPAAKDKPETVAAMRAKIEQLEAALEAAAKPSEVKQEQVDLDSDDDDTADATARRSGREQQQGFQFASGFSAGSATAKSKAKAKATAKTAAAKGLPQPQSGTATTNLSPSEVQAMNGGSGVNVMRSKLSGGLQNAGQQAMAKSESSAGRGRTNKGEVQEQLLAKLDEDMAVVARAHMVNSPTGKIGSLEYLVAKTFLNDPGSKPLTNNLNGVGSSSCFLELRP